MQAANLKQIANKQWLIDLSEPAEKNDKKIFFLCLEQLYKYKKVHKMKYKHFDANWNEYDVSRIARYRAKKSW